MDNDLSRDVIDRILLVLSQEEKFDLQKIKNKLVLIFSNYTVGPKENAIVVYTEGKNDYFLRKFLLAKAVAGRTQRTLEQYKGEISRALTAIGKDADVITSEDIQVHFARMLANGKSKCYCDNVRRDLSSFYAYLYREELVKTNPMNKIDNIKFKREKENAFTDMEIEKMRAVVKTSFEKALFETLLSTGCRAFEVCAIRISDLRNDRILIVGKGGKARHVYLNARAHIAIEGYLSERKDDNPFLFPSGKLHGEDGKISMQSKKGLWYQYPELVSDDKAYSKDSVNAAVKRIGKRAGVSNVHAHRFRRTCATHALRRGMPVEIVSMMLGHESIATTQIYLDIREDDLEAAHRKYVT